MIQFGSDTWRNMVGGGTFSGVQAIKVQIGLEVLLGHVRHKGNRKPEGLPQDLKLQKYADK